MIRNQYGRNSECQLDVTLVSETVKSRGIPWEYQVHHGKGGHLDILGKSRIQENQEKTSTFDNILHMRSDEPCPEKDPFSIYYTQHSCDGILPEVTKDYDVSTGSNTSDTGSEADSEAAQQSREFCWGLCCVQGCVWGVVAGLYFFLLLPTSFLLIVFGNNQDLPWAVVTGSVLLVVATCGIPGAAVLYRWMRRRRRERQKAYRQQRDAQAARATFDNPVELGGEEDEVLDAV